MSMGLLYWILMLLWFLFRIVTVFPAYGMYQHVGDTVMLFILFLLLGWKIFGKPIQ